VAPCRTHLIAGRRQESGYAGRVSRLAAAVVWTTILVLIAVTLVFAVLRVISDTPHLASGTHPDESDFESRYVAWPLLAYSHLVPGVLYLLGAPLQLSRRFRESHWTLHRRLGRVLLALGLTSGIFALAFGIPFSYGGPWQSLAAATFGSWFTVSLVLGYMAIRRRRTRAHRRWMIRASAVGLGVGTIRLWVGFFVVTGALSLEESFAPAFWLGLSMHVAAAELWLWWRPDASGRRRASVPTSSA
jgi:hypothetical protein